MNKALKLNELIKRLKKLSDELKRTPTLNEFAASGITRWNMEKHGGFLKILEKAGLNRLNPNALNQPKILVLDIETLPMIVYTWDLFPERIGLDQVIEDWSVASWSAKWYGESEMFYMDVRECKELRNDKAILKEMWNLIDQADIVVTQNGKSFDIKKLNARFFKHKMKPTTTFRHYDTKIMAKRYFKFTSNRLAFMTEEFNTVYKKLEHGNFPGFKLWLGCMAGNPEAWKEMEEYNKHDVLALEELFTLLLPWDKTINWNVFNDDLVNICSCGSQEFMYHDKEKTTNVGAYQRMVCKKCGKEHFTKDNLVSRRKRELLMR